ncbi:glycerol dehydratase reactivase beta/small subunit family protein [Effusibacillus dendaii]|uniref:PduH protein n=1 Tax=Effusibacillus dendaii TaxID=2743772 RepID=A0A7I8D8A0_9BACL|nr:glycerol dehydratase reactivase beta/small subunit family protein [Effusibacillus dendaii]BCJ85592.1 pduH protein [Effusibacillus dendaii]
MNKREIYIPILYEKSVPFEVLKEICAGLEEEGVPFRLVQREQDLGLVALGAVAASMSPLHVGIGVDSNEGLCLHHDKLRAEEPYLQDRIENGRRLGKNAARLVKGLPLYCS